MRSRLIRAALATAALGLAAPAAAHATLVYTKVGNKGSVWIANDDGTGARKLASNAGLPRISPDGQTVAYVAKIISKHPRVVTVPAAGGTPRTVIDRWGFGAVTWSSDSHWLLAIAGGFRHPNRLKLVDASTGASRTVARGFFSGASFSPDSAQIVYGSAAKQKTFQKTNLFVTTVAQGPTRQLTTDNHSLAPVWGPTQIAYTRYTRPTGKHRNDDGPKYNLFLIEPISGTSRQLTHDKVPYLLAGLTPALWSTDGTKLVAEFGGQDTFYGVKVDPVTGEEQKLRSIKMGSGRRSFRVPLVPAALSRDGQTILAYSGYIDSFEGDIYTLPYAGGKPTRIVRHAIDPDWTA
jgi:Tol biopolymer transport system component